MVGTGPFAVPTFRVLYDSYHQVVALVTSPVRLNRGKPIPGSNPMRETAEELGLPIYDPENINDPETISQLLKFQADLMVVCDYGYILSPEALAAAELGGGQSARVHASEVSRGSTDQLGHLPRRQRDGRHRDPYDATSRRRTMYRSSVGSD